MFSPDVQPTLSFKKTANILSSEPGKLLLSQLFEAPQWTSDRSRWRTPARLSVAIQTSNYQILQQIQTSQSDLSHLHDHWNHLGLEPFLRDWEQNDYRNRRSITISQFLQGAWISFFFISKKLIEIVEEIVEEIVWRKLCGGIVARCFNLLQDCRLHIICPAASGTLHSSLTPLRQLLPHSPWVFRQLAKIPRKFSANQRKLCFCVFCLIESSVSILDLSAAGRLPARVKLENTGNFRKAFEHGTSDTSTRHLDWTGALLPFLDLNFRWIC